MAVGLNRIEGRCKAENIASARVMEKCGLSFEGVLRQNTYFKGAFRDIKVYSILREEFKSRKRN